MAKIKICGLFREQDIDYVNEAEPDYAGFILCFPKSHRNLNIEQAEILRKRLRPEIQVVCVFVNQPMETVIDAVKRLRADVIQLHGHEDDSYITELKGRTGLEVWKAFRIRDGKDLAAAMISDADVVLLDNGYGTGETFDWSIIQSKEQIINRPFILAGGLTPENIEEAVSRFHPMIVDISSGVEKDSLKDREKIIDVVRAVRKLKRVIS